MSEMKGKILIATRNKHKIGKLVGIVYPFFEPLILNNLDDVEENGNTFLQVAQNKAIAYSRLYKQLAVSTDGGAVIPALKKKGWNPLLTKRFVKTDSDTDRIKTLLEAMKGENNRLVEWYEAIAVAQNGKLIFSDHAKAMDGEISEAFNPSYYREGIWLCSITDYPQFEGRNFFELTNEEQLATEDSWDTLAKSFSRFFKK